MNTHSMCYGASIILLQPHVGGFLASDLWWKSKNQANVWPSSGGMTSPKHFYSGCLPLYEYIRGQWTLTACVTAPPSYFYSPMLAGFSPQIWWKSQNQANVWPSSGGMTSPKHFYSGCLPLYEYIRGQWTLTACVSAPPSYFYSPMLAGFSPQIWWKSKNQANVWPSSGGMTSPKHFYSGCLPLYEYIRGQWTLTACVSAPPSYFYSPMLAGFSPQIWQKSQNQANVWPSSGGMTSPKHYNSGCLPLYEYIRGQWTLTAYLCCALYLAGFLPQTRTSPQIWQKSQNQANVWPSSGGMTSPKHYNSGCLPLYEYIRGQWTLTACVTAPPSYFYSPMLAGFSPQIWWKSKNQANVWPSSGGMTSPKCFYSGCLPLYEYIRGQWTLTACFSVPPSYFYSPMLAGFSPQIWQKSQNQANVWPSSGGMTSPKHYNSGCLPLYEYIRGQWTLTAYLCYVRLTYQVLLQPHVGKVSSPQIWWKSKNQANVWPSSGGMTSPKHFYSGCVCHCMNI